VDVRRGDVGADHIGVRRQFGKREELILPRIDENSQHKAVGRFAHMRHKLHHRPRESVRPGKPIHTRVDHD